MNPLSAWGAAAHAELHESKASTLFCSVDKTYRVVAGIDSVFILCKQARGNICFRAAFIPGGNYKIKRETKKGNDLTILLSSATANWHIKIKIPSGPTKILRYTTSITPQVDLKISYTPRDILFPVVSGSAQETAGKIHVHQVGTRSGLVHFSMTKPAGGSVLYFQNLSAIQAYCAQTKTSCAEVVGGQWPEIGFLLPATKDNALPKGKSFVISDAYVLLCDTLPKTEAQVTRNFLDGLSEIYLRIPKPQTKPHDWPAILSKGLHDLLESKGSWSQNNGHSYFNA